MKLDLEELYDLQYKLDEKVKEKVDPSYEVNSHYAMAHVIYAFHTEVHELANEVPFFKFWKHNHLTDKSRAIEELVDCVHFLLKIGLMRGYDRVVKEIEVFTLWEDYPIDELFYELRRNELDSIGRFQMAFSTLLGIARKLGFTESDIEKAYKLKNLENMKRQEEDY